MTNHTIRDLCAALSGDVKHLIACILTGRSDSCALQECLDRANTARDALAAEPVGEGATDEEIILQASKFFAYSDAHMGDPARWEGSDADLLAFARAILSLWGRPTTPPAPEVGEVAAELRHFVAEYKKMRGLDPEGIYSIQEGVEGREAHLRVRQLTRIATLLQQPPAPAPVVVPSEEELYDLADEFNGDPVPAMRATLSRWGCPATPAVPEVGELGELVDTLGWIAAQLGDIGWSDDSASVARSATLLQQLSTPAPAVVPVAGEAPVAIVHFEFEVLDQYDQDVASGDAPTLEEAAREGHHYLQQYQQDGPCTLELRRVEVLNSDAIPLPQAGEVEG